MYFDQSESAIRYEWGLEGVKLLAASSDAMIIVDVISFTTAVDAALSRGGKVYPYAWRDESSIEFARSVGALLAAGSRKDPAGYSLSPVSLLKLPRNSAIVLPSPNGATLSLATGTTPTFAGCLRNASAVAKAASAVGTRISVVAAGERWNDGSLRPALEDMIGAGAILHALPDVHSAEAEAAVTVFLHFRDRLEATLFACGSGKEAADRGTAADIHFAAQLDASGAAPRLIERAYQ